MWFLQADTLLLLTALSLAFGLASVLAKDRYRRVLRLMPVVDLAFLWYVSEKLTVFYVGYVLVTWLFVLLLRRVKQGRKVWFLLLCALCCVPLSYMRFAPVWGLPTMGLICIGLAYNMLKAIDVLYYEYFSGEKANAEIYVNYMLFLPVLTAGPVFRYRDFVRTWQAPVPLTLPRFSEAVKRVIRGLFSKVVLSALAAMLLSRLMGMEPRWYLSAVIPLVSLAVLFFDMAGYASIAIGLGYAMGVTVPENFKHPFRCASFTQFWRNWHVTVSDWIREHVFILFREYKLNKWHGAAISMAVMILMGAWHGFTKLFVLDGVLLGVFLAVESIFGLGTVNKRKVSRWYYALRCGIVIYLFAMNSMIFTLSTAQIKQVIFGFFSLFGGAA